MTIDLSLKELTLLSSCMDTEEIRLEDNGNTKSERYRRVIALHERIEQALKSARNEKGSYNGSSD